MFAFILAHVLSYALFNWKIKYWLIDWLIGTKSDSDSIDKNGDSDAGPGNGNSE